jgi:hypothetical protein
MAQGFNNSFEKAFQIGQQKGSDAALEAIKEKIKTDQTKAEETLKATTQRNANIATLISFGGQEALSKYGSIVEAGGNSFDTQKNIGETIKEISKMKMDNESLREQLNTVGNLNIGGKIQESSSGEVSLTQPTGNASQPEQSTVETTIKLGNQPSVSIKPKSAMELSNERFDYAKKQREFFEGTPEGIQEKLKNKIVEEVKLKETKDAIEVASNSNAAIDSFNSLKSSYYQGFQPTQLNLEEADFFDLAGGKIEGFNKKIQAALGSNPQAKAFLDQLPGFATTIARGGFSEKGTLTDTDRKVVVKMFNMALANKNEADVSFKKIEEILSKPALRASRLRIVNAGEKLEEQALPFNIKQTAIQMRDKVRKGGTDISDAEVVEYLLENIGKI